MSIGNDEFLFSYHIESGVASIIDSSLSHFDAEAWNARLQLALNGVITLLFHFVRVMTFICR